MSLSTLPNGFWEERLRAHGHTGWADPVIYAYDQCERLALIDFTLDRLGCAGGPALDFGCGSGDFSRLLLARGHRVCGYDPYVEPAIDSPAFTYAKTYADIPFAGDATLALSVTALDHVVTAPAARDALQVIRRCLRPGATFCLLEYALDDAADRARLGLKSDYQAFRTVEELQSLLTNAGFTVASVTPAPQPSFNPSRGYVAYRASWPARLRQRFRGPALRRVGFDTFLQKVAARHVRPLEFPPGAGTRSPLKLIHALSA